MHNLNWDAVSQAATEETLWKAKMLCDEGGDVIPYSQ